MDYKILCDLSVTAFGYSGIAFDTRLMFVALARQPQLNVAGFFQDIRSYASFTGSSTDIKYQSEFLQELTKAKLIKKSLVQKLAIILASCRSYSFTKIDPSLHQQIWQDFLQQSLYPEDLALMLSKDYYLTAYRQLLLKASLLLKTPRVRLNTEAFDFAIFQDGVPIAANVAKNTIPLIRYHDAIPLLFKDTLQHANQTPKLHRLGLQMPPKNAIFVCNSEPTRQDLIRIAPHLSNRSETIPPAFYINSKIPSHTAADLLPIIMQRASSKSIAPDNVAPELLQQAVKDIISQEAAYLIAVSTIEPRKNYVTLVKAWEIARTKSKKKLKLIIVGNQGWGYEEAYTAMAPHIKNADIIQLERVTPQELQILYAQAKAFISLSIFEGFGSPTIEAMQCHCPTILSDIPVYRWVAADAALYVDLNNLQNIASTIVTLIDADEEYRTGLIQRALIQIQRYSIENVGKQWQALFTQLKQNQGKLANHG